MDWKNRTPNYDKYPRKNMDHAKGRIFDGGHSIVQELKTRMQNKPEGILVLDGYHGVVFDELKTRILDPLGLDAELFCRRSQTSRNKTLSQNRSQCPG